MKRIYFFISVIFFGILASTIYSCTEDSKETCEPDEYCDAKTVTVCCTGDVCVYKYDGKEYTEDEIQQVYDDLGCSPASASKLTGTGDGLTDVFAQLKAQMKRVKERAKSSL
jgi:hypothetical protein